MRRQRNRTASRPTAGMLIVQMSRSSSPSRPLRARPALTGLGTRRDRRLVSASSATTRPASVFGLAHPPTSDSPRSRPAHAPSDSARGTTSSSIRRGARPTAQATTDSLRGRCGPCAESTSGLEPARARQRPAQPAAALARASVRGCWGDGSRTGLIPTTDRFGTALADIVRCRRAATCSCERFPAEAELAEAYGGGRVGRLRRGGGGPAGDGAQRSRPRSRPSAAGARCSTSAAGSASCSTRRGARLAGVTGSSRASSPRHTHASSSGSTCVTADLFDDRPARSSASTAVFMGDVIEHLPGPGAALDRIRDAARRRRRAGAGAPGRRQPPRTRDGRAAGGR